MRYFGCRWCDLPFIWGGACHAQPCHGAGELLFTRACVFAASGGHVRTRDHRGRGRRFVCWTQHEFGTLGAVTEIVGALTRDAECIKIRQLQTRSFFCHFQMQYIVTDAICDFHILTRKYVCCVGLSVVRCLCLRISVRV